MKKTMAALLLLAAAATGHAAKPEKATLRIDAAERHQRITGFGGFVCSPTFGYGHMSSTDIKKVWGAGSTVGCNIMRLYIPIGKGNWPASLSTAKLGKQMGLIVFASPWGQPSEWKTNNSPNAKNEGEEAGHLKAENYADYADYLNDYVLYLRENGVELDAISLQNEPDMQCDYAGCIWTPQEMADFVSNYAGRIDCRVIAPESVGLTDNYANALNTEAALANLDIYGVHQYGAMQAAYKDIAGKGKEVWMTEYLINWNANRPSTRNFRWADDAFDFARSINTCMLNDVSAWIHYAAKRFYGMLGDGECGTTSGAVTKRGYIMAQFAKYATGRTRVGASWRDDTAQLEGSAYLSAGGDTIVAVVINPSAADYELTVDLPFYTQGGTKIQTTQGANARKSLVDIASATCRPKVSIAKSSVTTLVFRKSGERTPSTLTATIANYDMAETLSTSKPAYETLFRLSGTTRTFDHSRPLFSNVQTDAKGHLTLARRYAQLVLHVDEVSSAMNLTSDNTTLHYINDEGKVASHNYGLISFAKTKDFDWAFDIGPATLPDGCRGIVGITNSNYTSVLTLKLGNVYLSEHQGRGYAMSGAFGHDASDWLDCMDDQRCTWIDATGATGLPSVLDIPGTAANGNCTIAVGCEAGTGGANVVAGGTCAKLALDASDGDFRPQSDFTASEATLACRIDGMRMLAIPFAASLPAGAEAYTIVQDGEKLDIAKWTDTTLPANTPLLIKADGDVVFSGSGAVAAQATATGDALAGSFASIPLYGGDYVLAEQDGAWGFARLEKSGTLPAFSAYYRPAASTGAAFIPFESSTSIERAATGVRTARGQSFYVSGIRAGNSARGLLIRDGQKILVK